jgi:hypothetical protein
VFSTDDELELAWLEVTESEDPKQQLQLYGEKIDSTRFFFL